MSRALKCRKSLNVGKAKKVWGGNCPLSHSFTSEFPSMILWRIIFADIEFVSWPKYVYFQYFQFTVQSDLKNYYSEGAVTIASYKFRLQNRRISLLIFQPNSSEVPISVIWIISFSEFSFRTIYLPPKAAEFSILIFIESPFVPILRIRRCSLSISVFGRRRDSRNFARSSEPKFEYPMMDIQPIAGDIWARAAGRRLMELCKTPDLATRLKNEKQVASFHSPQSH